jgi:diguanylate cyclase (GGDEF)-like protein
MGEDCSRLATVHDGVTMDFLDSAEQAKFRDEARACLAENTPGEDGTEQPDASLPTISRTLDVQIGQFIERERAEERIHYLANRDRLTGLLNRRSFSERLDRAIKQARRHKRRLAFLVIDLNDFKRINEMLGQQAGDVLLKQFAARLVTCFRRSDIVARLGGDEFGVVVQNYGEAAGVLCQLAQEVRQRVADPFLIEECEYRLTASMGCAVFPEDGTSGETLLRSADLAMCRAKLDGGNELRFSSAPTSLLDRDHLGMEGSLARAIKANQLSLVFQPIYHLGSQQVIGFEALMRWEHPEYGQVSPARFIPLAEEAGFICALGLFALRRACEEATLWPAPLFVAVNVSARQLLDDRFAQHVLKTLKATGFSADRLRLEITETTLMQSRAVSSLRQIRDLGVRLSIDDFGTGYSSLAYLKRLPIDSIKLDQTFVAGLPHDPNDTAITSAVIGLGHNLNLAVVAEGVEHDEQCHFLQKLGCDAIQGYLISRPIAAVDVPGWLQRFKSDSLRFHEA